MRRNIEMVQARPTSTRQMAEISERKKCPGAVDSSDKNSRGTMSREMKEMDCVYVSETGRGLKY